MRWPRKGILIRLAIYIPIIGYLGWQAIEKWRSERAVMEHAPQSHEDELQEHKRTIQLPDGRTQDVYELSPEQAERILGTKMPEEAAPAAPAAPEAAAKPEGAGTPAAPPASPAD